MDRRGFEPLASPILVKKENGKLQSNLPMPATAGSLFSFSPDIFLFSLRKEKGCCQGSDLPTDLPARTKSTIKN